jgi:hypothetical protein
MNSLKLLTTATIVTIGSAALVIAASAGFTPASVDKPAEGRLSAFPLVTAVVLVARETAQELVWDMTYGPERSPQ